MIERQRRWSIASVVATTLKDFSKCVNDMYSRSGAHSQCIERRATCPERFFKALIIGLSGFARRREWVMNYCAFSAFNFQS